jgi:uncharacterized membrane protein (UPF0127 family)
MRHARVLFSDVGGAPAAPLFVEIPTTLDEMFRGLAGRPSLNESAGMLFDMGGEAVHRFHMIGVAFPLDFLFVAGDGRVSSIRPSQPPGLPEVSGVARWVIEAPGGWAARSHVRVGMQATLA